MKVRDVAALHCRNGCMCPACSKRVLVADWRDSVFVAEVEFFREAFRSNAGMNL